MVIIIVLKPDVEVNLGQDLGHESWGSAWVDPSQRKNYSSYYHSLKTRLGSQSRTRSGLLVGRVNQVDKKNKNKSTQPGFGQKIEEKSMYFLPVFYLELIQVFEWIRSDQLFLYFFLKTD